MPENQTESTKPKDAEGVESSDLLAKYWEAMSPVMRHAYHNVALVHVIVRKGSMERLTTEEVAWKIAEAMTERAKEVEREHIKLLKRISPRIIIPANAIGEARTDNATPPQNQTL